MHKFFGNYLLWSFISLKKFDLFNSCNDNKAAHRCGYRSNRQTGIESADFGFECVCVIFASNHSKWVSMCVRCLCVKYIGQSFVCTDEKLFTGMSWRVGNRIITQFHPEWNQMNEAWTFLWALYSTLIWCDVMVFGQSTFNLLLICKFLQPYSDGLGRI